MSHRPLVFVAGLTVGDYLVWNWSLNGNHDVLALVSGLTLPPLVVASVWLLALSAARLLARSARRRSGAGRRSRGQAPPGPAQEAHTAAARASRKLAA